MSRKTICGVSLVIASVAIAMLAPQTAWVRDVQPTLVYDYFSFMPNVMRAEKTATPTLRPTPTLLPTLRPTPTPAPPFSPN